MANISESMDQIIYVGIGIFILVLLLSLVYESQAINNQQLIQQASYATVVTNSPAAINMVVANILTITPSGSTGWISAANPLTVVVTGNAITTYATNAVYAVSTTSNSQTFTLTSSSAYSTAGGTGDFYSINSIVLTAGTGAFPSITATVQQGPYNSIAHGSVPSTGNWATNSIIGTGVLTYAAGSGAVYNYTTYAGPLPNTFGGALQLAVFALVFIAVILAVLGALRGRGAAPSTPSSGMLS